MIRVKTEEPPYERNKRASSWTLFGDGVIACGFGIVKYLLLSFVGKAYDCLVIEYDMISRLIH